MHDKMIEFIRENPGEATSQILAERFLMFKCPDPQLAHRAVEAILAKDRRCFFSENKTWEAEKFDSSSGDSLSELPLAAIHLLEHSAGNRTQIHHVSVWAVHPEPTCLLSEWLRDPSSLSADDQALLVAEPDALEKPKSRGDIIAEIASVLDCHVPFYITRRQQSLLWRLFLDEGESCNDDGITLNQLFSGAELQRPRPLTLEKCYATLFGSDPIAASPAESGKFLGECAREVIARLRQLGIETREELEEKEASRGTEINLEGKTFSRRDLSQLPSKPGVYAFTNKAGHYLYIGKSSNLKRRVGGYFRQSEESPGKVEALREQSHGLTVVPCGSELEALIYEYRLIRKHAPSLNSQKAISERKGEFASFPDSIVLLPHAEEGKAMSFWFRAGQKTAIKPFDPHCSDQPGLEQELQDFFFSHKLTSSPNDFPEQEISTRWITRHRDSLICIPAATYVSGKEMLDAMISYWKEMYSGGFSL